MSASDSASPSLPEIAQRLFDDALHNIIHDTILQQHRAHKQLLFTLDPTTKLPHCANCALPRLIDPPLAPKVRGATSDPPSNTQYCDRKPWSRRPGHDIYDNPFPRSDVTGRPPTKKEREAAKKDSKDTPASEENTQNGTAPTSPSADQDGNGGSGTGKTRDVPLEKGEKKASKIDEKLKKGEYVPWHTCPSCKRSLLITRFAKHLEQCMGLSGRQASRNAMAKMGNGTPSGSRGGTPNAEGKDDDADEGEGGVDGKEKGGVRKKLLKKGIDKKIRKEKEKGVGGKVPKASGAKKVRASPAPSSSELNGDGKRDREGSLAGEEGDDGDEVHVKKRMKLQRVGSTASVASSAAPFSALERTESFDGDGSFVDEGSVVED